jgi:hypothetical protein
MNKVLCIKSYNINDVEMLTKGNFYEIISDDNLVLSKFNDQIFKCLSDRIISTNSSAMNLMFSPEELKEYLITIPEMRKMKLNKLLK